MSSVYIIEVFLIIVIESAWHGLIPLLLCSIMFFIISFILRTKHDSLIQGMPTPLRRTSKAYTDQNLLLRLTTNFKQAHTSKGNIYVVCY